MLESKRNQGIAPKAVRLFAKKVCEIRMVDYFLIQRITDDEIDYITQSIVPLIEKLLQQTNV